MWVVPKALLLLLASEQLLQVIVLEKAFWSSRAVLCSFHPLPVPVYGIRAQRPLFSSRRKGGKIGRN